MKFLRNLLKIPWLFTIAVEYLKGLSCKPYHRGLIFKVFLLERYFLKFSQPHPPLKFYIKNKKAPLDRNIRVLTAKLILDVVLKKNDE